MDHLVHPTQLSINTSAIRHNLAQLKTRLPPENRLTMMVKANGYGTDLVQLGKVSQTAGADCLGVAFVSEGVRLREAGVTLPILVIYADSSEANTIVALDLEVCCSTEKLLLSLQAAAKQLQKPAMIHLQLNTGFNRFGATPSDSLKLAIAAQRAPEIAIIGIMTHLAAAGDEAEDPFSKQQIQQFLEYRDTLQAHHIQWVWSHVANTAALIRFDLPSVNSARPGLGCLGMYTASALRKNSPLDLKLALSLTTEIVATQSPPNGASVGYGRRHRIQQKEGRIAILPIGYADGYHISYSERGSCWVRGQSAPMVGRICMDFMMIDISDIPGAQVGDRVELFGDSSFPEEVADQLGTISHELIASLGPRIQRHFTSKKLTFA